MCVCVYIHTYTPQDRCICIFFIFQLVYSQYYFVLGSHMTRQSYLQSVPPDNAHPAPYIDIIGLAKIPI